MTKASELSQEGGTSQERGILGAFLVRKRVIIRASG